MVIDHASIRAVQQLRWMEANSLHMFSTMTSSIEGMWDGNQAPATIGSGTYGYPHGVSVPTAWPSANSQIRRHLWELRQSWSFPSWRRFKRQSSWQELHVCLQSSELALMSITVASKVRYKAVILAWGAPLNVSRFLAIQRRTCSTLMSTSRVRYAESSGTQSFSRCSERAAYPSHDWQSCLRCRSRWPGLGSKSERTNWLEVSE